MYQLFLACILCLPHNDGITTWNTRGLVSGLSFCRGVFISPFCGACGLPCCRPFKSTLSRLYPFGRIKWGVSLDNRQMYLIPAMYTTRRCCLRLSSLHGSSRTSQVCKDWGRAHSSGRKLDDAGTVDSADPSGVPGICPLQHVHVP